MSVKFNKTVVISLIAFTIGLMPARADTQVWSTRTGDWFVVKNWTNTTDYANTRIPADGDDVVVTNSAALVYLVNSSARLNSMIISNATVSCSNWNTTLYTSNLTILKSGVLTCWGPFTNNVMSNRVSLTCSNLFIETNGSIYVKGKGYSGGINVGVNYLDGYGPGGGSPGAGHGGEGGGEGMLIRAGTVYGSATAPLYPGSGGRAGSGAGTFGGHGGGAVCVTAVQVVVNGSINADATQGTSGSRDCGGSGGSIYITCTTITGTNGAITADGSNVKCLFDTSIPGGGGGGGRIAVLYDQGAQSPLPVPSIRFSAAAGMGGFVTNAGDIGTLYFPDNYFFSPTNLFTGQWLAPGTISVSLSDWVISNTWTRMSASSITVTNTLTVAGTNYGQSKLEVTNNVVISCGQFRLNGASLVLGKYTVTGQTNMLNGTTSGPTLNCSGDLTLTTTSRFYISAGLTNSGAEAGYGARVIVGGDIRVATNCWILPCAHPTNGAVVLFSMRNMNIDYSSGFNVDGLGYAGGPRSSGGPAYGPGTGVVYGGGSSYGGKGSNAVGTAGQVYGSSNAPVEPGSGARAGYASGAGDGSFGGGSVRIRATDTVTVKGTITANALQPGPSYAPGASGGGIYITCRTFIGDSNGVLQANGGNGCYTSGATTGGGGGGGRIAVWRILDRSTTIISNYVNGGVGYNANTGGPGTIVWGWIVPPNGSIVSIY